jgi:hypothetical protein
MRLRVLAMGANPQCGRRAIPAGEVARAAPQLSGIAPHLASGHPGAAGQGSMSPRRIA